MKTYRLVMSIYLLFSFLYPFCDAFGGSAQAHSIAVEYACAEHFDGAGYGGEEDDGIAPLAYSSNQFKTYDNFMEAYFDGLTENFGDNKKGSCGYIALSMLLTYYDTFLSDDIVPDRYDEVSKDTDTNMILRDNSPGSSDFGFADNVVKDTSGKEYFELIKANQYLSLHARLIYLGQTLYGLYKFGNTDNDNCGLSIDNTINILEWFLQYESNIDSSQYSVRSKTSGSSESIRKEIIAEIKSGNPVLVNIKDSSTGSLHACIAYAYDEATDEVYFHNGWHGWDTHCTLSYMQYDTYTKYLVVRFNIEHSHSNNYAVEQADGTYKYYCYCDEEIITYKHDECKYTYKYTANDGTHTAYCTCGNSIVQNHSYTYRYDRFNELQHIAYCACGRSVAQNHTWTLSGNGSALKKLLVCTGCKLSKPDDLKTPVTRD